MLSAERNHLIVDRVTAEVLPFTGPQLLGADYNCNMEKSHLEANNHAQTSVDLPDGSAARGWL